VRQKREAMMKDNRKLFRKEEVEKVSSGDDEEGEEEMSEGSVK
jgi:hypothetical protein